MERSIHKLFSTDLPARKTRALEGSSNKLKLTTQRNQVKTTMETYHPVWSKGGSQPSGSSVHSLSTKSSTRKPIIRCGQCENDGANLKCLDCMEMYCANCFSLFHLRGALKYHRSIPLPDNHLSRSPKKQPNPTTDSNPKRVSPRSSTNDFRRRSLMTLHLPESDDLTNDRTNLASFQHSFLQWREKNVNRADRSGQKRGYMSSTHQSSLNGLDYTSKLPNIESNSTKNQQHDQKNNHEGSMQRSNRSHLMKKEQPKVNVVINIHHSSSDRTESNHSNTEVQPLNEHLSLTEAEASVQTIPDEETANNEFNLQRNEVEERPVTHVSSKSSSRPASSLINNDSIPSRPSSLTRHHQALRASLTTKSNDELEAILGASLTLSRSTSSISETDNQPSNPIHQNSLPEQSVPTNEDLPYPVEQFHLPLNDLVDECKPEITKRSLASIPPMLSGKEQVSNHVFRLEATNDTLRRHSPFSFANSLSNIHRMNSSSSTDAGEGGFFTDILPRKPIPSPPPPVPPILECSTSNEWKHAPENELPQTIPKSPVRRSSQASMKLEEIPRLSKPHLDSVSRPGSSLSSASLPMSISSSKLSFAHPQNPSVVASSRKNSSSSTSTLRNSSPTRKITSPSLEIILPISTTEQAPIDSIEEKSFSNSPDLNNQTSEKLFTQDLPVRKRVRPHRQTVPDPESSKCRKLGFSIGDGLQWQEASTESVCSTETVLDDPSPPILTARSLALSNPINTELAQEFCQYDNDDGRSSRTYQNVNDDDCFNQLRQELCSQLEMISSDEDAILNEQLLNILQSVRMPMLETTSSATHFNQ